MIISDIHGDIYNLNKVLDIYFKEKCNKLIILGDLFNYGFCLNREDIINRLKEYDINPVVADSWADKEIAKHEYGVDLVDFNKLPKADCVIVAVGHNEFRSMSTMQLKELFKDSLPEEEKVLIDVKSLYRYDELVASGMKFWRL